MATNIVKDTNSIKATNSINNKVFRFNLSEDIMQMITRFAKTHQYDDRHTYKEAWQNWSAMQQEILEREISRLKQLGYKGDVMDKMFKAGRYYFREKKTEQGNTAKETKEEKREYIIMNQDVILAMDKHLNGIMKQPDFKPAKGYTQFCEQHIELLRREISRFKEENVPSDKIAEKIKKTYKNRYFMLSKLN
jgi:hypothetical protein